MQMHHICNLHTDIENIRHIDDTTRYYNNLSYTDIATTHIQMKTI